MLFKEELTIVFLSALFHPNPPFHYTCTERSGISLPFMKRGSSKVTKRQMWSELVRRQKEKKTVLYIYMYLKQTTEARKVRKL